MTMQKIKTIWIEPITGMEFINVPEGTFMMGDSFGVGKPNETPLHEVRLNSFYIGKYPVTQAQWKKVIKENPSYFQAGDDYPVEEVSQDEAGDFIRDLTSMNDWEYKFRLPTEAEWEYAARSSGREEKYAGGNEAEPVAWHAGNSNGMTHPVGQKAPNHLGIYDMSGNVWEWSQDLYDPDAYTVSKLDNPVCTTGGPHQVIRGGSWGEPEDLVRCAARGSFMPSARFNSLGFRLVREILF